MADRAERDSTRAADKPPDPMGPAGSRQQQLAAPASDSSPGVIFHNQNGLTITMTTIRISSRVGTSFIARQ